MKSIDTSMLCCHCLLAVARYTSKANKLCCEDNVSKCPAIKKQIGAKTKRALSTINSTSGLTKAKEFAKSRKEKAKLAGALDPYTVAATKMALARTLNGSYLTATAKSLITKNIVDSEGLTILERSALKMVDTRTKIGSTGLSSYQQGAIKATITKLTDIDSKGRNGFDRMWIKGGQAKEFKDTFLYYRSKLELIFLEKLVSTNGLDWVIANVKNPKAIPYYFESKRRLYIPDFKIDSTIFEIKSQYTFNDFGKNLRWELKNISKLDSALSTGVKVILVLDGKDYLWEDFRKNYE